MFLFVILTFLIPAGIVAALIIAEIFLMKKERTKLGLILPIAVFVIVTALSFPASVIREYSSGEDIQIAVYENDESMEMIGTLDLVEDEDENIMGFSRLRVENGEAVSYLELEFDDSGELVGSEEALQYKEALEYSLTDSYLDGELKLHGKSLNSSEFDKLSEEAGTEREYYEVKNTLGVMAFYNIPTVILFVIYAVYMLKIKRRKKRSIDDTRIKDL